MATKSDYMGNFLRWRAGRQSSGYEKMLLVANPYVLPFDCYLLRYKPGSSVPRHTDPVDDKRHYRMNIVLRKAKAGGEFQCEDPIYSGARLKLFRPDRSPHAVSPIEQGVRYVLSIGWVRK